MPDWVEYLLRILLAIGLGFILGLERQFRLKVAGIRTHAIVSAGAALFVIVSIYGFPESDASRVAAQIVSGIGFIGAGMIMHRQNAVLGLTSAAGIWLTAAIGMAAGAGMYIVAAGATVLIFVVQLFMHLPLRIFKDKHINELHITFSCADEESQTNIKALFGIESFQDFKADRSSGEVTYRATIHTRKQIDDEFISKTIKDYPYIISIHRSENDK